LVAGLRAEHPAQRPFAQWTWLAVLDLLHEAAVPSFSGIEAFFALLESRFSVRGFGSSTDENSDKSSPDDASLEDW
jgi:hypothetical protein